MKLKNLVFGFIALIALLTPKASASNASLIRVEAAGTGWRYYFYWPSSVRASGNIVTFDLLSAYYTPFSWQDAERRRIWIQPNMVARGSFHLDEYTVFRETVYCSERNYSSQRTGHVDALHPDETKWAIGRDVAYYNQNRPWPIIGRLGDQYLSNGDGASSFIRNSAIGDIAARYCR